MQDVHAMGGEAGEVSCQAQSVAGGTETVVETTGYYAVVEPAWGFIEDGRFIRIPKRPLELAGMRPPCAVRMWDGTSRNIIEEPQPAPGHTDLMVPPENIDEYLKENPCLTNP